MCDLFGMCANEKDRATRSLPILSERYSDIDQDGWGIAYYEDNRVIVKKKPGKAKTNPEFARVVENARSNIIIGHLRLGSHGGRCERNCHPFVQHFRNKDWVFAHNGIVNGIPDHPRSQGETDSEDVFNYILDYVNEYQSQGSIRGTYPGIANAMKDIYTKFGTSNTINMLMSDGTILYAFNHYRGKPMYYLKREKDYGGAILVSTRKLTQEDWKELPADKLFLLNRGEILVLSDDLRHFER